MVKRVNDIDKKKNEFKNELIQSKKNNIKLSKQKHLVEVELEEISEQIEQGDIAALLRQKQSNSIKNKRQMQQMEAA